MSTTDPPFTIYMQEMFRKNGSDYESIVSALNDSKAKLEVLSHFYYYICTPQKSEPEVREELQLIGITSLMEAMMQEEKYLGPIEYFKSKYPKENLIMDVKKFEEEYLSKYGAARKVKEYFKKYISQGQDEIDGFGIEVWNEKKYSFVPLRKINEIAVFFYNMRSEFVHNATMHGLKPLDVDAMLTSVNGKGYDVEIDMTSFLNIFEKSFVKFWTEKNIS